MGKRNWSIRLKIGESLYGIQRRVNNHDHMLYIFYIKWYFMLKYIKDKLNKFK